MIYVASSWRNFYQEGIVAVLRAAKLDVYDFKNPSEGNNGFHWSEIDPDWKHWNFEQYQEALRSSTAEEGFKSDFDAMKASDTFILVLPCGRSAHLELGWAVGAGKKTAVLAEGRDAQFEPELMYKMVDFLTWSVMDLLAWLGIED